MAVAKREKFGCVPSRGQAVNVRMGSSETGLHFVEFVVCRFLATCCFIPSTPRGSLVHSPQNCHKTPLLPRDGTCWIEIILPRAGSCLSCTVL